MWGEPTSTNYQRVPERDGVTANCHRYLNGYPLGARCALHVSAPAARGIVRIVERARPVQELEVVWNGA